MFPWVVVVADIAHPILGCDILYHLKLDVCVHRRCLVESSAKLPVQGLSPPLTTTGIRAPLPTSLHVGILTDFPSITRPCNLERGPSPSVAQ